MVDRRAFLTGSVFAAAVATWPGRGGARAPNRSGVDMPELSVALVDRSLDGSGAFVAQARARGPPRRSSSRATWPAFGCASSSRACAPGSLPIAGHTSAATLFCLDFLARDYGARTSSVAERGAAVSLSFPKHPDAARRYAPAAVRAQWSDSHA